MSGFEKYQSSYIEELIFRNGRFGELYNFMCRTGYGFLMVYALERFLPDKFNGIVEVHSGSFFVGDSKRNLFNFFAEFCNGLLVKVADFSLSFGCIFDVKYSNSKNYMDGSLNGWIINGGFCHVGENDDLLKDSDSRLVFDFGCAYKSVFVDDVLFDIVFDGEYRFMKHEYFVSMVDKIVTYLESAKVLFDGDSDMEAIVSVRDLHYDEVRDVQKCIDWIKNGGVGVFD